MVIKNVAFGGNLRNNLLRFHVEEIYCSLRFGHWHFRIDSLHATVKVDTRTHVSIGCSLLQSDQLLNGRIVSAFTPLHVCTISYSRGFPIYVPLLVPGQTDWLEFRDGSQDIELSFTDISEAGTGKKVLDLFVCGVIQLERVD